MMILSQSDQPALPISFIDFIRKNSKKHKATSNVKNQHTLSSLVLKGVKIDFRDGLFPSDLGFVNLHLSNECPGLHIFFKITSIHMLVHLVKNCLCLL